MDANAIDLRIPKSDCDEVWPRLYYEMTENLLFYPETFERRKEDAIVRYGESI